MIRATTVVLLTMFCIATIGCAAARQAEMATTNAPTANVVGTWTGNAGTGGVSVPITLSMDQKGTNVTGNISIAGRPDLSGPVQGGLLKLSLPTTTLGEMTVKQDTFTGMPASGLPVTLRRSK